MREVLPRYPQAIKKKIDTSIFLPVYSLAMQARPDKTAAADLKVGRVANSPISPPWETQQPFFNWHAALPRFSPRAPRRTVSESARTGYLAGCGTVCTKGAAVGESYGYAHRNTSQAVEQQSKRAMLQSGVSAFPTRATEEAR
jgi:hypothetical protein